MRKRLLCFGDRLADASQKFAHVINAVGRRGRMLFHRIGPAQTRNLFLAGTDFLLRRSRPMGMPPLVSIDISPRCNLHCTVCVHAHPASSPLLPRQRFSREQDMTVEQYRHIIDQIRGRAMAVGLFYLGDPLVHPRVDEFCRIAADARLYVHISTNLSFRLDDARIRSLLRSGLSSLTVCIDGMTQESYGKTRVGGRIDLVIDNLRRACRFRRRAGRTSPKIEVQFIKYKHNLHELPRARAFAAECGVDQFASFWGVLCNYSDVDETSSYTVLGPRKRRRLPYCHMPYLSPVIKCDGDVIPCGMFRRSAQYAEGGESRALGNIFTQDFESIWRCEAYGKIRRMVCDPSLADSDPSYRSLFCYACPIPYHTDSPKALRMGDQYGFEELYDLDERGIPVRKARSAGRIARLISACGGGGKRMRARPEDPAVRTDPYGSTTGARGFPKWPLLLTQTD